MAVGRRVAVLVLAAVLFPAAGIGHVALRQPSAMEVRLARFIVAHGSGRVDVGKTARILAGSKRPRLMAAIAAAESRFDPEAVGRDGEVSMFQILKWPGGNPRDTAHALRVAESHLEEKIAVADGRLWEGVRRYNGKGRKACRYREKVRRLVEEI